MAAGAFVSDGAVVGAVVAVLSGGLVELGRGVFDGFMVFVGVNAMVEVTVRVGAGVEVGGIVPVTVGVFVT